MKLPRHLAPTLFGLILSGLMSLIVSGIATVRSVGFVQALPGIWFGAWLTSWLLAFPVVLIMAPLTRKLVARITADGSPGTGQVCRLK